MQISVGKSSNKKRFNKDNFWGVLLASPPLIGFVLFGLFPMLFSIVISVSDLKGYLIEDMTFLGWRSLFDNYIFLFKDELFWKSIGNTFYATLALPITMVISLMLSVFLNQKLKGKTFLRTVFFLPYVCSIVALTSMWRMVLNQNYGILNEFLAVFGVKKIGWLSDPKYFMPAMIIMGIWSGLGFNIILFSAALTKVNPSYYEAAKVDGASAWKQFWNITIPAISPTTFYLLVMGLIGSIQDFTRFQAIGFGETPSNAGLTVVFYLYNMAFKDNYTYGMGLAAACSWIVALMIIGITIINFKMSKKWVYYD